MINKNLLAPNLQAFMAIANAQTVHGAAKNLFITQTAVTQRLKSLEAELGVSLFVRSRRGMLLTTEGEILLRYCLSVESLSQETLSHIQKTGVHNYAPCTISGPTSVLQGRVLPIIARLIKKFPAVLFGLRYQDDKDSITLLKNGTVQFAIVPNEWVTREMCSQALTPESYILVASHKWKERKLRDIIIDERIVDFNSDDLMTITYLRHFNLAKDLVFERYYANHPEAMLHLIKEGCAYSVLEKTFAAPFLKNGELIALNQGKIYENPISLVWYERPTLPEYFKALLAELT
jgi:LysR family transcriptional regulator (chromosome initiation inhibitor)